MIYEVLETFRVNCRSECVRSCSLQMISQMKFRSTGLGRVYFRSSMAHWSEREAISIKRNPAFCWGNATHHIYPISFFTVWRFASVSFSSTKRVFVSASSSSHRWESLRFINFPFASLNPHENPLFQTQHEEKMFEKRTNILLSWSADPSEGTAVHHSSFDPSWHPELTLFVFGADLWPSPDRCKLVWAVRFYELFVSLSGKTKCYNYIEHLHNVNIWCVRFYRLNRF